MKAFILEEKDRPLWDSYVSGSGSASCYHLSVWKDVIEGAFGHRSYYLYAKRRDDSISGILPLVHLKSRLFGSFMVSLPYFNYGGLCYDDGEAKTMLLDEAIRISTELKASHLELRHTADDLCALPVKTAKVSMRLELPATKEKLLESFPSKLRSQIRRPEKEGMSAVIGGKELLESFYSVFTRNMRDLGTPVYPKSFFAGILDRMPGTARVATVYTKEGAPAASGLLIGFKDSIEIPWASSIRKLNNLSPNMLLYWSALKFAVESGYRIFDFGRSTPGGGTYRFKEQWGAKAVQLYWYYWLRGGGAMPELNPGNPKFALAIGLWKRLPLRLTTLLGPRIVKYLP